MAKQTKRTKARTGDTLALMAFNDAIAAVDEALKRSRAMTRSTRSTSRSSRPR